MAVGGAILRILQTLIRALQLCCAILVCGVFAYFLAVLARHDLPIATYVRAVTGMSGAGIIYTAFAVLLTLCFAGIAFLGYLAILLDICFIGCFAAIAYYSRGGAGSCSGTVNTPVGSGPAGSTAPGSGPNGPGLRRSCKLNTAVFAVSLVAIFLFLLSAILQFLLIRNHKKEKRYGPSPSNNYTSGAGKKQPFWKRSGRGNHATGDIETVHKETTLGGGVSEPKYGQPGYGQGHNNTATNY